MLSSLPCKDISSWPSNGTVPPIPFLPRPVATAISGSTIRSGLHQYFFPDCIAMLSIMSLSWSKRFCSPGYSSQKPCITVPTITLHGSLSDVVFTLTQVRQLEKIFKELSAKTTWNQGLFLKSPCSEDLPPCALPMRCSIFIICICEESADIKMASHIIIGSWWNHIEPSVAHVIALSPI